MKQQVRLLPDQRILIYWTAFLFLGAALLMLPRLTFAKTISVGAVGEIASEEIKKYLPLAKYLAKQLGSEEYDQGKVVVARSIREMASFLREGKADLYVDSPFPAAAVSRLSGSKFLLLRLKKGLSEYHSVIFVKKESGIDQLQQLNGKMIAFKEPFSSSGYFVPKMVLVQRGFKVVPKKDAADPVGPREVGYVFSEDEENTVVWVLRGKVSAGVTDNQRYVEKAGSSQESLKIIYESFSFPRHVVSIRGDMAPTLAQRIKDILMKMHLSEEGKKTLEDFEKTTRFDELPDRAMAPFLKAGRLIDAELGIK